MKNKLKSIRESRGMTQDQAAAAMGTTRNMYAKLEAGARTLNSKWISAAVEAFGIEPADLFSIGPLAELQPQTEKQFNSNVPIPEFNVRAGAAYGGGMDDDDWNDENGMPSNTPLARWGLPRPFVEQELGVPVAQSSIIQIKGDSMDDGTAHALVSGDRVIVDHADTDTRQGGIFVVWDGDGVIVKQVELMRGEEPPKIVCTSLNKRYAPIMLILDGSVKIIGRAAGRITRI